MVYTFQTSSSIASLLLEEGGGGGVLYTPTLDSPICSDFC